MSKRYLVVTEVDGKLKMLSLVTNTVKLRDARRLSRRMADKLFKGHRLGRVVVQPWPDLEIRRK